MAQLLAAGCEAETTTPTRQPLQHLQDTNKRTTSAKVMRQLNKAATQWWDSGMHHVLRPTIHSKQHQGICLSPV
jgi:hypothetical protein